MVITLRPLAHDTLRLALPYTSVHGSKASLQNAQYESIVYMTRWFAQALRVVLLHSMWWHLTAAVGHRSSSAP